MDLEGGRDVDAWLADGTAAYLAGDFAAALAAADEAAGRAPDRPEGLRLRSVALLALGRWDDATVSAELARSVAPDDATSAALIDAVAAAVRTGADVAGPAPFGRLTVGERRASLAEEAEAALDRHRREQDAADRQRPAAILRDPMGRPLPSDTGGVVTRRGRELPSPGIARAGLVVFGVLALLLALWLWRGSADAGAGSPTTTVCRGSALDFGGHPIDIRC